MKSLLHTFICCLIISQLHAQTSKIKNEWTTFKAANQKSAVNLIQDKATLKLAQDDRLTLFSTQDDALGYRHTRYQQTYKNVPIEGAIYLIHEKNNRVQIANGKLVRDLNISVTPSIPEATALQSALEHINATLYAWDDPTHENLKKQIEACEDATFYPAGELVIIDPKYGEKAEQYRLAYKFDIYAVEPLTRSVVYVDAHNGEVLTTVERIHNCLDDPATDTSTASGTTNYSEDVSFTACGDNGGYTLANSLGGGMQVFDAANTNGYPQIPFTSNQAFFDEDPTANEVHWATQKTYEYLLDTFNRNSLDDNGMPLYSWVHYGTDYNNAFWNGSWMTYGDGDGVLFSPLTAPDVVGHEMVHGITQFSAGLNYSYESGALNESFSDIFGEVAERYMRGSNDWLMGKDFTKLAGKDCIRDMSNPNSPTALTQQPDTYLGNYWYDSSGDNGGVHYNSGVQNYWFYLLSEGGLGTNDNWYTYHVNGIGMDKAANIAYRNLTVYLSETSQYTDARAGAIQAAIDLYGAGSNEAIQTEEAWCAVGLCSFNAPCRMSDSLALVALYNATDGANWTNTWDLNQPMDTWYGVALNGNGCVTCIDMDGVPECHHSNPGLSGNNLVGNIPSELGNLSYLKILSLSKNDLSGSIPPELGNLASLESLRLESNYLLTGSIPSELGNLNNLTILNLSFNSLSGSIPVELGNLGNLSHLMLGSNDLNGSIPAELGDLNNLRFLSLESNNLTGSIPSDLGNLINLERLWLSLNQLTGSIPPELGNLNNISQLFLSNNQLSGTIPIELTSLTNLTRLSLSSNQLTGTIPIGFGNLSNLDDLSLSNNQLTGNIPPELGNLNLLEFLRLGDNQLSGNIPFELGNLNNLLYLELRNNQLDDCYDINLTNLCSQLGIYNTNNYVSNGNNFDATWEDFCATGAGECPYAACRYSDSLALIALYNSTDGANWINTWDLNQPMDSWFGVTLNVEGCVEEIILSSNGLSGSLPPEIGNLSHLTKLWLGDNTLTGNIPSEISNLSNLGNLILSNNQLSGSIPPELGNLNNLWYVDISYNQLSGCYDVNLNNLCSFPDVTNWSIEPGNNFDAMFIDFCLNGDAICPHTTTAVWPGDFNNDGVVNNLDLLQWGLAEGITGIPRPNASTDWLSEYCPDWHANIDSINVKHADGDGNGIVDIDDIQALTDNYGNTHTVTPYTYTESPLKYRLEYVSSTTQNGTISTVYDLYVESSLGIPVSTHGLACRIDFGGMPVNSASFDFSNSALVPDEYLQRFDVSQNTIDIALTRTDKNNQNCTSPIARGVVVTDDLQSGNPFAISSSGKMMFANGILTDVSSTAQFGVISEVGVYGDFSASVSATYIQCNDAGEATVEAVGGTEPYTYTWSTGETTQQVSDLSVGIHSVTVTDSTGLYQVIDSIEIQWAFTPVEVTTSSTQICINFDNAPLAEAVQVSLNNGATYQSPITTNTCYNIATGTHHVWIQRVADQCPVDLGTVTVSSGGGCSSRVADANLVAIGGEFGQFANNEFIKNFLTAEKTYIKYQAEINRILESKDARYTKVNEDFDKIKDMAMAMLFQSFVSKRPVTVTDEHIKAIDNFLVSLNQVTSKGKLRNEITKVRQHLHVMESKEVKDALIAFDRAGATDTSDITPFDTPDQDDFDVQLLNTAGRESRVTYNIVKQGIINMSLYNTHGQQVRTLHNGISYEGQHHIPIDKSGLPPGIYFIHIEYIADGVPINKILKLPVMK